ncbi:MAG: hypothetical protein JO033_21770 [Acidobacteriaceae bacterium]|nr:hypothetical protein [Acidobacteriaceae bacterium]MBV9497882.1 hypothetical protein [Acidobacteriaceae bacterium]
MFKTLSFIPAAVLALALVLGTGCNTQPAHPNQINAFDGATYDSLILAHAALTSLRSEVITSYRKYTPEFNQAVAAYAAAYSAYALFRTQSGAEGSVTVEIDNLVVAVVALESAFEADMHLSPQTIANIRGRASVIRARAGKNVTASDILTELEVAAAIAETVPAAQPYAKLAALVIAATSDALAAEKSSTGQPITLDSIQPVPVI